MTHEYIAVVSRELCINDVPVFRLQVNHVLGIGRISFEDTGNIGKSYRRHDEIGTPLCITVDFDTIGKSEKAENHDTVTIRDRDTMQQTRIHLSRLEEYTKNYFL